MTTSSAKRSNYGIPGGTLRGEGKTARGDQRGKNCEGQTARGDLRGRQARRVQACSEVYHCCH